MMVQVNQATEGMVEIGFEGDWEWLWSPLLNAGEAAELGRWLTAWVNDRPRLQRVDAGAGLLQPGGR